MDQAVAFHLSHALPGWGAPWKKFSKLPESPKRREKGLSVNAVADKLRKLSRSNVASFSEKDVRLKFNVRHQTAKAALKTVRLENIRRSA
jgi:hypothetical protein